MVVDVVRTLEQFIGARVGAEQAHQRIPKASTPRPVISEYALPHLEGVADSSHAGSSVRGW
ncbi:hypothetical protein C8F04DRAFT_1263026 [Mycena alexandri]|uniref:Uncharacterized protein n=1 Tax=Mycena alexandri TaxID=1745969 RepID=A0AAD6SNN3_9AGAR|nr:hypothetical protein C8F04DRAFT_1263026 [Mycena alexandri]